MLSNCPLTSLSSPCRSDDVAGVYCKGDIITGIYTIESHDIQVYVSKGDTAGMIGYLNI